MSLTECFFAVFCAFLAAVLTTLAGLMASAAVEDDGKEDEP